MNGNSFCRSSSGEKVATNLSHPLPLVSFFPTPSKKKHWWSFFVRRFLYFVWKFRFLFFSCLFFNSGRRRLLILLLFLPRRAPMGFSRFPFRKGSKENSFRRFSQTLEWHRAQQRRHCPTLLMTLFFPAEFCGVTSLLPFPSLFQPYNCWTFFFFHVCRLCLSLRLSLSRSRRLHFFVIPRHASTLTFYLVSFSLSAFPPTLGLTFIFGCLFTQKKFPVCLIPYSLLGLQHLVLASGNTRKHCEWFEYAYLWQSDGYFK